MFFFGGGARLISVVPVDYYISQCIIEPCCIRYYINSRGSTFLALLFLMDGVSHGGAIVSRRVFCFGPDNGEGAKKFEQYITVAVPL